jgi:hypothetical protein
MPTINAYISQPTALLFETEDGQKAASALIEFGGWDYVGKTLTPIRVAALSRMPGAPTLTWVMDSFAAAAEAGRLDSDRFIDQLLTSKADIRDFRQILREVGTERWVNDRHINALRKFGMVDFDIATYPAISGFFDPAE